jgi:hypothetical protein
MKKILRNSNGTAFYSLNFIFRKLRLDLVLSYFIKKQTLLDSVIVKGINLRRPIDFFSTSYHSFKFKSYSFPIQCPNTKFMWKCVSTHDIAHLPFAYVDKIVKATYVLLFQFNEQNIILLHGYELNNLAPSSV